MAGPEGLLHLHCGDAAAAVHRKSGLPGALGVVRDSPSVGPWTGDVRALADLRGRWWGIPPGRWREDDLGEVPSSAEVVLWFGPDPWEQASLLWTLARLPEDLLPDLVMLPRGAGALAAGELPPAFAARLLLGPEILSAARSLWARFLAAGWAGLGDSGLPGLPHLGAALARLAEDHPAQGAGRSLRQVRALLDQGLRDLPGLLAGFAELEAPGHGAWVGDLVLARMAEAMGVRLG